MLNRFAKTASRVMQALIPNSPQMYQSAAAMPSTAAFADYWYNSMGLPNAAGIVGGEEAYEFVSGCFAATRLLCAVGSKMPMNRMEQTVTSDGDESSRVMRNDPVHKLMNYRANPDQTSMVFRSMMVAWQVNRGTAFAEIQRDGKENPMWFWPIHPGRCKPFRDEKDELWWNVRNNNGTETQIPDRDMLRIPYTVLDKSGLRGVGVADRAIQTIQLGQNLDRTENDASLAGVPRIAVEAPQKMNQPERDEFRREWREIYQQGGDGVVLLAGGATVKPLSWTATDSAHVPRREFNIEDIARWYDVPLTLLRRAIKESAGNVEQLGQEFQTYSLTFLEIWEQELAAKTMTEEDRDSGQCFELDYKSLLKADHTGRASYYAQRFPIGSITPNQVRKAEGENPYPDGNRYYVQGAYRPVDEPYSANSPQDPPGNPLEGKRSSSKGPKTKAKLKAGARVMLEDCFRRLIHKESVGAMRAAKKPGEWIASLDAFYADHRPWMLAELKLPLEMCGLVGFKADAAELVDSHIAKSREALLSSSDGDSEQFADRVRELTESWDKNRAAATVQAIAELN